MLDYNDERLRFLEGQNFDLGLKVTALTKRYDDAKKHLENTTQMLVQEQKKAVSRQARINELEAMLTKLGYANFLWIM